VPLALKFKKEQTNVDKTQEHVVADFSAAELEIFSVARAAGEHLRRSSFAQWIAIGKATEVAKRHAEPGGGGAKKRNARYRKIMADQNLGWVSAANRRTEVVRLGQVMAKLTAVEKWRSSLSDFERTRWSSPQSIFNRCPAFHPDGRTKGPTITAKAMSVSELLKMPSDEIALLLYRRVPAKMFVMRSMEALAATGSAVKPKSGWAKEREHAAGASVAAA
jgi:hypothetical protein